MPHDADVSESSNDRTPDPAVAGGVRPGLERSKPRKRPKDRADRILAAAAQLFRERGYHAVGIDDIGAAVGTSGPAVYRYFDGKEALLVAATERSFEQFILAYREAAAAPTPHERVAELVRAAIVGTIEERDLSAIFQREYRHIARERLQPMRTMLRENRGLWIRALTDLRPMLTPALAGFMVRSVNGLTNSIVYFPVPPLPRARWAEILTRMGQAAILTPPSGAAGRDGRSIRSGTFAGTLPSPTVNAPVTSSSEPAAYDTVLTRGSRREAILAAAVRLFRQHGYGGVGIEDIGAAAGITGPGVYRHFESKDDLLGAAFTRAGELLAAGVSRAFDDARTPRDALEGMLTSYIEITIENSDLMSVWLTESQSLGAEHAVAFRRSQGAFFDDWVGVLGDLRPELSEPERRAMVRGALGIVNGYTLLHLPLEGHERTSSQARSVEGLPSIVFAIVTAALDA